MRDKHIFTKLGFSILSSVASMQTEPGAGYQRLTVRPQASFLTATHLCPKKPTFLRIKRTARLPSGCVSCSSSSKRSSPLPNSPKLAARGALRNTGDRSTSHNPPVKYLNSDFPFQPPPFIGRVKYPVKTRAGLPGYRSC